MQKYLILLKLINLRAIFWENRESQDTHQNIEFFIILPKHPF